MSLLGRALYFCVPFAIGALLGLGLAAAGVPVWVAYAAGVPLLCFGAWWVYVR